MALKPVAVVPANVIHVPRKEKFVLTDEMVEEMVKDYLNKKGVMCSSAKVSMHHKDRRDYYDYEMVDGQKVYYYTTVWVTWQ